MRTSFILLAVALGLVVATTASAGDVGSAQADESAIQQPRIVFPNLLEQVEQLSESDWVPFRPGVTAHWLYKEGNGGPACVLLRYEPGARVPLHEHVGYEHIYIVKGDQYDEYGSYPAGSFIVNPPGTRHSPGSQGGCVALLIYEKAVRFATPSE